jgi:dihydroxyacetone kinase phosphotransfer subunit
LSRNNTKSYGILRYKTFIKFEITRFKGETNRYKSGCLVTIVIASMVGIVIVSHSEKLAIGVQELATQMVHGSMWADAPRFAIAAGIDDVENPLGTDAMQIYQAIELVYSDEGVVVLMDLGSAVLSAELALEFLPEEQRAKVRLCDAPLVEGAIAAVVQAANGANIEQVIAEARGALAAKVAQLSGLEAQLTAFVPSQDQQTTNNKQLKSISLSKTRWVYTPVRLPNLLPPLPGSSLTSPCKMLLLAASRLMARVLIKS